MAKVKKTKVGWVRLYRSVQSHWVFADADHFKAWIDLLLLASWHDLKNVNLEIIQEGELIVSQRDLSLRWSWGRQRVRQFLGKLELDGMITQYATQSATKITICNYSIYQGNGTSKVTQQQPTDNPPATHEQPTLIYKEKEEVKEVEEETITIGTITFKLSFVKAKEKLFPMLDVVGEIRKCVNWHTGKGRAIKDWSKAEYSKFVKRRYFK